MNKEITDIYRKPFSNGQRSSLIFFEVITNFVIQKDPVKSTLNVMPSTSIRYDQFINSTETFFFISGISTF